MRAFIRCGAVLALTSCLAAAPALAADAAASGASTASPAKKALVTKVLSLQQPGVEALARQLAEQPAVQMLQQVGVALQRVAPDKRDALARDIQADVRKYVDEATPIVRDQALKLAPQVIGPMLEKEFSDDELKQIINMLESPVYKKLQGMLGQIQRTLGERLVAESRAGVEPKVTALQQAIRKKLETALAAPAAPGSSPKK